MKKNKTLKSIKSSLIQLPQKMATDILNGKYKDKKKKKKLLKKLFKCFYLIKQKNKRRYKVRKAKNFQNLF